MSICILTNTVSKKYIEDDYIIKKSSYILNAEILDFETKNIQHYINKNYKNVLIYFDSYVTNINRFYELLKKININKTFVINYIPHKEKVLQNNILKYVEEKALHYIVPNKKELEEFYNLSDRFIFYSQEDRDDFYKFYNLKNKKNAVIIPSIENKNKFEVDRNNIQSVYPHIGFNGNIEYKKGLYEMLFSVYNLNYKNLSINIFGTHGKDETIEEDLLNFYTENLTNVNFKGKLVNSKRFFRYNTFYFGCANYHSFSPFCLENISNGMVPLLSKGSHYHSLLEDYPFTIEDQTVDSYSILFDKIFNFDSNYFFTLLKDKNKILSKYNNEYFNNNIKKFLNE